MKNQIFYSLFVAATVLLFSCQTPEKPASETPPPAAPPAASTSPRAKFPVNCFEQRLPDGSVLSFQYTEYYDQVVGILDYTFAEKDGAHGTFTGKKEGDIITATWSYVVEGSSQREEIMVKIDGDMARKASGELVESKDGVLRLKDAASAEWQETFTRVQCD